MTTVKTFGARAVLALLMLAIVGCQRHTDSNGVSPDEPLVKSAVAAYMYFYPLVVFGVSDEVLTNVAQPTWQRSAAPLNQFTSVRESDPSNHGAVLPSTDTLYTLAWIDVTSEPVVFEAPAIPKVPGSTRNRFMMYQFMDAWTNVYYSDGLRKGHVKPTNFVMVGPDFTGTLPSIPNSLVVHCTSNQSWLIVRTQVEGPKDLDNVHAIQDKYALTPLSAFGKPYTPPAGAVNPNIPSEPGPSAQANALDGQAFFTKASEWFNKVPFPQADQETGIGNTLGALGIKHGEKFDWSALSVRQKLAMTLAAKLVQAEFRKIAKNPASLGDLKQGWLIPGAQTGNFGTNFKLRAGIGYLGFAANLPIDGFYPYLVKDSKGDPLEGSKKYILTFQKGQLPPAGAFWSVTMYQDQFLTPNSANKFAVSSWMNPKMNSDGTLTIYMQPTSPGADKELNWLPSSGSLPAPTPMMRLYWPLPPALDGTWTPPPAVEVQ